MHVPRPSLIWPTRQSTPVDSSLWRSAAAAYPRFGTRFSCANSVAEMRSAICRPEERPCALRLPVVLQLVAPALIARQGETDMTKWHVFFADERCVPLDHADSNYGAAKAILLDQLPIPPTQIVTIDPALSPTEARQN